MRFGAKLSALALAVSLVALAVPTAAADKPLEAVDLALVLAVDISNSINPAQYQLQMAGLAQAFEDKDVQDAILSGGHGAILVTLVAWSDKPRIAIPWTPIASQLDALALAARLRDRPRIEGNFTCVIGRYALRPRPGPAAPADPRRAPDHRRLWRWEGEL